MRGARDRGRRLACRDGTSTDDGPPARGAATSGRGSAALHRHRRWRRSPDCHATARSPRRPMAARAETDRIVGATSSRHVTASRARPYTTRKDGVEMDDNLRLARTWMIVAGIALLGAGLIGFIPGNPIASADPDALFRVNT